MPDIRAVAAAFGLGQLEGEPQALSGGEQGRAWTVASSHGRWVVKQLSSDRARDRVADADAFATAAGRRVSIPSALLLDDGGPLLDGSAVGAPGTWFRVMEWLDLADDGIVDAQALGEVAAVIHRVDCPATRDIEEWFAHGLDESAWESLLAEAWTADATWVGELQRRIPALGRLHELTDSRPGRPLVSHRDLNLTNLRRTRTGQLVVLDWDLCGPIDPRRELALALVQLEVSEAGSAITAYRSYLGALGPARMDALDAFASVSIALDNLVRHYASQLLAHDGDHDRAGDRLGWLFNAIDLVTPAWLDRLVGRLSTIAD